MSRCDAPLSGSCTGATATSDWCGPAGTAGAIAVVEHGRLAGRDGPLRCIEAQLMADAAAGARGTETIKIGHEEAEYTRRVYTDEMEYNMFQSQ